MKTIDEIRIQAALLEGEEAAVLRVLLAAGAGLENAVSAASLAAAAMVPARDLRKIVNGLIRYRKILICSKAGKGGGYFLPAEEQEVEQFYQAFWRRGMCGLVKGSMGRKLAAADLITQIGFAWEEDPAILAARKEAGDAPKPGSTAWAQAAARFLERITQDPATYHIELEYFRQHFGVMLVPREWLPRLIEAEKRATETAETIRKAIEGIAA
jgi:hypothetical protein